MLRPLSMDIIFLSYFCFECFMILLKSVTNQKLEEFATKIIEIILWQIETVSRVID